MTFQLLAGTQQHLQRLEQDATSSEYGVLRTCSPVQKKVRLSSQASPATSSWTAAAYEAKDFAKEYEMDEVRHDGWVSVVDEHGRLEPSLPDVTLGHASRHASRWVRHAWSTFLEVETQLEFECFCSCCEAPALDGG